MRDIFDTAVELLTAVEAIFSDAGITLPERRYVHHGEVSRDCEQVTVTFTRAFPGLPGQEESDAVRCEFGRSMGFLVEITRCVPVGTDPPSASALQDSAQALSDDAQTLWHGLLARYRAGELFDKCDGFRVGPVEAIGPEGGHGGNGVVVEVQS